MNIVISIALVCVTIIAVCIVYAAAKCKEPRLKRVECFTDENGNIVRWSKEYE